MADVEWDLPDGSIGVFPDTMSDVQIKGIIAHAFPKEVGAAVAANPNRDMTSVRPFNGANVPGYDPATGIVSGGAIDDKTGNEYGIGIRQNLESMAGMPGDIGAMIGRGAGKIAELFGADPKHQQTVQDIASYATPFPGAASTQQIQENVTDPLFGKSDDPLTLKGDIARTSGNFATGAFAPGGVLRKIASMVLPAVGSEAAGQVAKEYAPEAEPYARFGGALAGGALTVPKIGGKPIAEAAKDLGVKTKDMTRVIKRMQQDGMTPQQIQTRLAELGPDATMMDVGPNLRQEGQRIYAQGGRGRGVIDDALTPRDQGANARIQSETNANLGPPVVPSQIEAGIKANKKALSPAYEALFDGAGTVDAKPIANDLASTIAVERGKAQTDLKSVRDMLNIPGTDILDTNPRTLHSTREAIDGMLRGEKDTNVIRVLTSARKKIDGELENAVPGIKEVDAQYAELSRQKEALDRGQTVLDSGRTTPRPSELSSEVSQGALPQGKQIGPSAAPVRLKEGARADIDRIIGTNANDRVALQRLIKGEGDWNREKLATLFGPDKADRMIAVLEREGTFADTSNRVMKGSATAERLPEGSSGMSVKDAFSAGGPKSIAYSGLVKGVEAAMDKFRGAAAANRDERVARILSSTDAQKITTALLKANGGKALPQDQIEAAVRALLLTSGAKSQSAK